MAASAKYNHIIILDSEHSKIIDQFLLYGMKSLHKYNLSANNAIVKPFYRLSDEKEIFLNHSQPEIDGHRLLHSPEAFMNA